MAVSAFQKVLNRLFKEFALRNGREPQTPKEWMDLQNEAVQFFNRTKGVPPGPKKPPFQGWKPEVIQGGKGIESLMKKPKEKSFMEEMMDRGHKAIKPGTREYDEYMKKTRWHKKNMDDLIKSGDVQLGKAPKTTQGILKAKKDRHILMRDADEDILRIKRENKESIRRFKEKMDKKEPKTVEDFRDKGDWDPYGMAEGGIAPLVGEPSYAADFYDDRTPMKKGRKVKKKKLTKQEKIKELIKRMPPRMWRQLPYGKKRYKKRKDLPEGILELLEKDPGFDREAFEDIYWAGKGQRWTDPDSMSSGMRGQYSGMTGDISLNLAPFGEEEFLKFKAKVPHTPDIALTDIGKAGIAQHELRHKNILEDRELFETQPEWVKKNMQPGYLADQAKGLYDVTGHELYNRFLDQRYYPTEDEPGKYHPYIDKILKDHWEPHAKAYEDRARRRLEERRGEGIETLAAQGGRIGMAGGGALFKFIERLFIKASNDIRQGKGKWKGLDQKQRIVQHDNLTKKVVEFQKSGNTEGLEIYFDVNPHEAFAKAQAKVKKPKVKDEYYSKKDMEKEWAHEDELAKQEMQQEDQMIDKALSGMDERQLLKTKYPGISDDLLNKILIDDNPQRKADVIGTIDDYMKLREIGKSEGEAFDIITQSFSKNPTKHAEGGRIGYAGGGKAGLPAISAGRPQGPAMQQPQMPAGPQPAGIPGGTIVAQNQMQQAPWMGSQMQQGIGGMPRPQPGGMPRPQPGGMPRPQPQGQPRMPFGLGGMTRRAFMKLMAGITGTGVAAGTGLLKLGSKAAPKAIKETAEVITRTPDGMPSYIYDLIEVVKAKGTKDIIEGFKKSDYSTVHSYKGVDVIEDGAGNIKIKSDRGGVATDPETGKMHEGIAQEHHMQIDRGEWIEPTKTKKGIQTPDEYIEGTVRPDMDGKMKDFEEGLDEDVHEFFKEIADEGSFLTQKRNRTGKASGGLAYALGE